MGVPLVLGLDFGTSGARACVMAASGAVDAMEQVSFDSVTADERTAMWQSVLAELIECVPPRTRARLAALAIDGTSGTLLACDAAAAPVSAALMYDDARALDQAAMIAAVAGADHPVATPTSALAKALWLLPQLPAEPGLFFAHQADWLAALLTGQAGYSDWHNALKLGFEPATGDWPDWMAALLPSERLPSVQRPGTPIGRACSSLAKKLGLSAAPQVRAGTTDSIAAFLATGVQAPGEAVSSLGSTLALKLVSHARVDDARYGVYSHWFGRYWLAGGASNAGGAVLRQFFTDEELARLSAQIDPAQASGLDYYPLPRVGERFPEFDPAKTPILTPRPNEPTQFLHGMLEGLARIEATGYQRLMALGATQLTRVHSTGGGADNPTYAALRARALRVPVTRPEHHTAAYGSARLACLGQAVFPL